MLDWMKKLFNKEEEKTAMNKEVQKQDESQPKIPRVNHYTEAREAQMASRNVGAKCRFPLIPDDGFDEEDVEETTRFEEQPIQRIMSMERRRRTYVEKQQEIVPASIEPEFVPDPEPIVKKTSVPVQESNRRPFRPTEMISPIFGYNRPSAKQQVVKKEEQEREDLEISVEGKSVVDAWLEKKGYKLSDFSESVQISSNNEEEEFVHGQKEEKRGEKSVVDQWLEKNGYETERQVPSLEEQEQVQEMREPREVSTDYQLQKPAGQKGQEEGAAKQTIATLQALEPEQDVVVLFKEDNEETLQKESVDSKIENADTILTEEIECKTEIEEQPVETTILEENITEVVAKKQVEDETPEETVVVEAEEETPEEAVTVEAEEETPEEAVTVEAEEATFEEAVTVEAEEETPEETVVVEAEEESPEEAVTVEAEEESPEETVTVEVEEETLEEAVTVEAEEESPEETVTVEAEKETLEEAVTVEAEKETLEEAVTVEAEKETLEEAVTVEAEKETFEEAVTVEAEEETPEETEGTPEESVISQQETIERKEENEVPTSEADEQTKKDVQSFANVLIEEAAEKKNVAEEQLAMQKEEPKREKKRHVPFNVVMLKQDRKKLMERHTARMNVTHSPVGERIEEKTMQQVVVEAQVEEKPMQQVVVEAQVEEKPMQQVVVEAQVEEKPMQQVVVEAQVEEKPMQQVVVEAQVEEKPMQQVVVEAQVEEKPMQQVVVEAQVEEKPMQQIVVEAQVEEKPMQQIVVEAQVEEKPMQQVQAPISSTEVQEKAYVVNQREHDIRNVLQTPPKYELPSLTLLTIPAQSTLDNTEWLEEQKELLDTTFNNFHVGAHVINVSQGPAVTRFEVQPDPGVKVNKITNLSDDIKLSLAAKDVRIEAPIPGKSAIGIEVPNKESKPVFLREILRSPVFTKSESPLTVALGLDISGDPIVTDIRKMPHGLIAGATGSGKSVCINAILTSILYKAKPHEVKLMLIDPKMVELAPYNSVPHLVAPVITDVKAATAALKWAVDEMEHRYELFAHAGARDLTRYNTIVSEREIPGETLPYIVIVIDELADLMMVAPGDVEEAICRIAQKARACGIHLLVATQRPSVDVITGLIKSNIPTRIAFTVSSQVDSRTIIDIGGAEKLLGRGDMLFLGNGTSKPVRVQGVYVSDDEIEKTVDHVKKQMKPNYLFKQEDLLAKTEQSESEDELFFDACQFVVEQGGASTSSVQRKFRIGYNRAARLIEEMESQGIISEARGTKPRDVLISEDEFAAMQETNV
ncbi:DNA translocase FtsK [Bacillus clarus]|uniref:DNA translocase FtsK n=1 Tax=Bacillus clarus TaxID=2338372 RepID=A0ABX9KZE0_9BACI|nr:DNA translocase FtsK [Bacillus clarus]RFT68079.1 DNA translocase FtsK [Bacillus clarus]